MHVKQYFLNIVITANNLKCCLRVKQMEQFSNVAITYRQQLFDYM